MAMEARIHRRNSFWILFLFYGARSKFDFNTWQVEAEDHQSVEVWYPAFILWGKIIIWFSYLAGWSGRPSICWGVVLKLMSFKVVRSFNKKWFGVVQQTRLATGAFGWSWQPRRGRSWQDWGRGNPCSFMLKTKIQLPWQECPMTTADPAPEAGLKP